MASVVNGDPIVQAAATAAAHETIPSTACLFNLVVFCPNRERVEYFQQFIQATVDHFPCRIVFIQQEEQQTALTTEMALVNTKSDDSQIICDQLTVKANAQSLCHVPFVLFPFILPDLPLFLVWDCNPTIEQEILPKLQPYASRLIFDSETIDNLQRFAHHILAYKGTSYVVDLNWIRIGGWRELVYKMFDTEERVRHLQQAQEFRVTYNAVENQFFHHNQTQAIYLQAWLAAQLGWNYHSLGASHGKSEIRYSTTIGSTTVTLQPTQVEGHAPGSILSIELLSTEGMTLQATRKPGTQQVTVHTSSDLSCKLPYSLNLRGTQLSYPFLKETLYLYGSQHYQHMLHMLKQQDWNRK